MKPPPHPRVRAMTVVLRVGTYVSTALLVLGLALWIALPQAAARHSLLKTGLIILMTTPVAHLIVAIIDELTAREWRFVAAGILVLLLLGGSLVVAFS